MNVTALAIGAAFAGFMLGCIGTAMYYLPKIAERDEEIAAQDFCIDNLLDELDQQEAMDSVFHEAANRYRVKQ